MLLTSLNTNGKRVRSFNEICWCHTVGFYSQGQINNKLRRDLDRWLSLGSRKTGDPAVAVLHCSSQSNPFSSHWNLQAL